MGFQEIDVLGFSIGGMVAQQLALDYPKLVKRLLLLGTGPRGGGGYDISRAFGRRAHRRRRVSVGRAHSLPTESSQSAGKMLLDRLAWRREGRDDAVSRKTVEAQILALREWGAVPQKDRYLTLKQIPPAHALIVHGNRDAVVNPINALILTAQHIPQSQLIVLPDASHAAFSSAWKQISEAHRPVLFKLTSC